MKKRVLLTVLLLVCLTPVFAQQKPKLDQIQVNSLPAVPNIKVDGKLTEWGKDFQAFNKATKIFYSMANDDKNLYLIIHSNDYVTTNKIEAGGISLLINTANKKSDKEAFSVTFPVTKPWSRGLRVPRPGGREATPEKDSIAREEALQKHNQFIAESKEISVLGFKDITDTLISVYNEYSIKPAMSYDAEGNFSYELSVPLKALGLSTADPKEFSYRITLNGRIIPPGRGDRGGNFRDLDLESPTDLWGKYTLYKK